MIIQCKNIYQGWTVKIKIANSQSQNVVGFKYSELMMYNTYIMSLQPLYYVVQFSLQPP